MKKIHNNKLMFITNYQSAHSHLEQVHTAISAGVKWIQYRPKNVSEQDIITEGNNISYLCRKNNITLILNDSVHLVKEIKANGVHIGQKDMPVDKARELLGKDYIIGGTANTIDDINSLYNKNADYIGLGPFTYTTTKKNLSPTLGLIGYKNIIEELNNRNIQIPIYAIGGIKPEHIQDIMRTGVNGIAVSSVLSETDNMKNIVNTINSLINNSNN